MSTGDNLIPTLPYFGDWEVPTTLNDTWGYKSFDTHWKSPEDILRLLVKINSRGGNYLLNVGPDGRGVIPEASARILRDVGEWLSLNGASVYGTQPVPVFPYESPWGTYTYKPGKLYLHVFNWQESIHLHGLANDIHKAYWLSTQMTVPVERRYIPSLKQHRTTLQLGPTPQNALDSVICLELKEDKLVFDSLDTL